MVKCRLCGSKTRTTLFNKGHFTIVKCNICHLIFTDFQPNSAFLKSYYSKNYFVNGADKQSYDDYWAEERAIRLTSQFRISRLKLKRNGIALDIGCAYGFFLSELPTRWKKFGVEVSSYAGNIARKINPNSKIINGTITKHLFSGRQFDLITLWDVIEHLNEPKKTLNICYSLLKKGGKIALTTGDAGSMFAKFCGQSWHLYNPPQHLSYFSTKTITNLLQKTGFQQISITHPTSYYPISYLTHKLYNLYHLPIPIPKNILSQTVPVNLFDIMMVTATK